MEGKKEKGFKSGFVALVGETNAGKSTLLNALLQKKVSIVTSKAHTTRNRILGMKNSKNSQIVFVDTPGFVKKQRITELNKYTNKIIEQSTDEVDLLILVIDSESYARNRRSISDLVPAYKKHFSKIPAIVVLNKVDLVKKELLLPLIQTFYKVFNTDSTKEVAIVPVSAKKNDGVDLLAKLIEEKLPEGDLLFPEDSISDQEEDFFAAEIIREKLFANLREELPYSVAVRIDNWVEEGELLKLNAVIYVERDSQKSIIIGKGGSALKQVGQDARLELEQLYQCKVYLELFVKVEPKWTESVSGLRKVGYE